MAGGVYYPPQSGGGGFDLAGFLNWAYQVGQDKQRLALQQAAFDLQKQQAEQQMGWENQLNPLQAEIMRARGATERQNFAEGQQRMEWNPKLWQQQLDTALAAQQEHLAGADYNRQGAAGRFYGNMLDVAKGSPILGGQAQQAYGAMRQQYPNVGLPASFDMAAAQATQKELEQREQQFNIDRIKAQHPPQYRVIRTVENGQPVEKIVEVKPGESYPVYEKKEIDPMEWQKTIYNQLGWVDDPLLRKRMYWSGKDADAIKRVGMPAFNQLYELYNAGIIDGAKLNSNMYELSGAMRTDVDEKRINPTLPTLEQPLRTNEVVAKINKMYRGQVQGPATNKYGVVTAPSSRPASRPASTQGEVATSEDPRLRALVDKAKALTARYKASGNKDVDAYAEALKILAQIEAIKGAK